MSAVVARWDTFLAKIAERLEELIEEAGAGVLQIGRAFADDPLPLGNALTGLDFRLRQLKDRIGETWDSQVEALFQAGGDALWDRGLDRKADAELALEHRWAEAKAGWLAALAQEAKARADREAREPVPCTQCGGTLSLPNRRESASVRCGACGSVCEIASAPASRWWWGAGVEALAELAALPLRFEIDRFRVEADRWRRARKWAAEPVESLEKWRRLELGYWRTKADARARLTGEAPDEALVASRMEMFDRYNLQTNQTWVAARGR